MGGEQVWGGGQQPDPRGPCGPGKGLGLRPEREISWGFPQGVTARFACQEGSSLPWRKQKGTKRQVDGEEAAGTEPMGKMTCGLNQGRGASEERQPQLGMCFGGELMCS